MKEKFISIMKRYYNHINNVEKYKRISYFICVIIIQMLFFYLWTNNLYDTKYYEMSTKEYYAFKIYREIMIYAIPVFVVALNFFLTKVKFCGILGIIISSPFILTYGLVIDKNIVQAFEGDYWFFMPEVIIIIFKQVAIAFLLSTLMIVITLIVNKVNSLIRYKY